MHSSSIVTTLTRAAASVCALTMCVTLAACGQDSSTSSDASASSSNTLPKLTGVTATGTPGEKPKITFKAPLTAENNSIALLQEGNGAALESGDRLCVQLTSYSLKTGEEISTTWKTNQPACSLIYTPDEKVSNTSDTTIAQIANAGLKGQKLNSTLAIASNDGNSDGQAYMLVVTPVSQSKDYTKAEGKKVTDIPSDLPKVTTAENGKPSIDMNGYKGSKSLVAQTLIEGTGAKITDKTSYAVVQYSGWLLDGKQFDSSWDRGQAFTANLQGGVIKGWTEGLQGKTVGSQVLLVVPPDLGYGDKAQGEIPANSTLVFVVDILAAY